MWSAMRKVIPGVALGSGGYFCYKFYTRMKYSEKIEDNDSFIIYTPNQKIDFSSKLTALNIPVLTTSHWFQPLDFGLDIGKSKTGVVFVKKDTKNFLFSPLQDPDAFEKWLSFHLNPFKSVSSRGELLSLLKNRKNDAFLDLFILYYSPENDSEREKVFNEAVLYMNFKGYNQYFIPSGKKNFQIVKVTDAGLAEELKIKNPSTFLKISDPRSAFSTRKTRSDYKSPEEIKEYITEKLSESLRPCGHEFQLDNQLFFDRFELSESEEGLSKNFDQVFEALTKIDPLVVPLFRQIDIFLAESTIFQIASQENSKVLVISLKKQHKERTLGDLQGIAAALKLESFAFKNPNVVVMIGYPEILYHLPIKDLAIYHYEDVEVRLMTINKGVVVNSLPLDEKMTLDDLLASDETRLESSPFKPIQNAEILSPEKFNTKILHDKNRCAFVMNCSKTCPACVYSDRFFQEAAKESQTCKFYKYYVSNQNPIYKGPNSTPRFHFYKPGHEGPIVYEQKVNGLDPKNFLDFIKNHLENS